MLKAKGRNGLQLQSLSYFRLPKQVYFGQKNVCFGIKSGIGQWRTAVPLVVKCHNCDVESVDADDESL